MKRLVILLLLGALSVGYAASAQNQKQTKSSYGDSASRKFSKKQEKAMKRQAKKQRKADQKMIKTSRKNTHYPPRQY
jgi:Ni/Co efflux regulator RcnB